MKKRIIVIGATGHQGKSVVDHLLKNKEFEIIALTRNPDNYQGNAHNAVGGNLNDRKSLMKAFESAYGVFAVTNFWEGADEFAQGKNIVEAAKLQGVEHFIWSTLPNTSEISNGKINVPHFTGKALLDEHIANAGFKSYHFVQCAFYYQNFNEMLKPTRLQNGKLGWTFPLPADRKMYMVDVTDLGKLVGGIFAKIDHIKSGNYYSIAGEYMSFNDIINAFKSANSDYEFDYQYVDANVFSTFFEGAQELAEMFQFFEKYTCFGPDHKLTVKDGNTTSTEGFNAFSNWIKTDFQLNS